MQRSYPEIFFRLRETITCRLRTVAKIERFIRFHRLKIWSILKALNLHNKPHTSLFGDVRGPDDVNSFVICGIMNSMGDR